ncbi:hypothetical protein [Rhodococcus sp. NPDC047139]|uniref:hypothetical protein n=1 Tax=Rhodococcus sp. NPDC047139 TaxID=3155141 RepID=UPI0033E9C859
MSEPEPETGATHRRHIPSHLLGGRIRTTTFALCSLWVGLWVLYQFLNQPDEPPSAPSTAVIISETPYVPYVPPATTPAPQQSPFATTAPSPSTTVPTAPPPTTTVPAPRQGQTTTQQVPTTPTPTTTTRQFPFDLPTIPGLSEEQNGTVPDDTGAPAP